MTRFLLPLNDAVDLVLYALLAGENGAMYVRKSPASTVETLAKAMCEIFDYKSGYEEVGKRAGEKMHETLISYEEMARAEELDKYYKIPPESQGLDYNKYLVNGKKENNEDFQAYTSENTTRLNIEETKQLLLSLPEIKHELGI
jgi:UDP-N-acetylglucosamine 4,6-dehydratase